MLLFFEDTKIELCLFVINRGIALVFYRSVGVGSRFARHIHIDIGTN